MDENLTNVIEKAAKDFSCNVGDSRDSHTIETYVSIKVTEAGYRLDPYPSGKSKGELIARIETVETERDKTRNLLRVEHDKAICKGNMALLMSYRSVHEENEPDCPVCAFLAETSSVKP